MELNKNLNKHLFFDYTAMFCMNSFQPVIIIKFKLLINQITYN